MGKCTVPMSIIISSINCLPEKLISGYPPPFSFDFVNEEKAEQPNNLTLKAVLDR